MGGDLISVSLGVSEKSMKNAISRRQKTYPVLGRQRKANLSRRSRSISSGMIRPKRA